jgi:trans-2,3-dihydro-3-hydroxyanthranilate isomerase
MAPGQTHRYRVVDVFTEQLLEGNPLAVFPYASGIDELTMQKIARELNLSETTFVLPPSNKECAARVRIFTPTKEMVFAGHPTIGTTSCCWKKESYQRHAANFCWRRRWGRSRFEWNPASAR